MNLRRLLPLPALLLFTACSPTIQVNSIPSGKMGSKLDRVFLIMGSGPSGSGQLMSSLEKALEQRLDQAGVASKGWTRSVLAVDEDTKIAAAAAAFQARYLLVIEQTSVTLTNGAAKGTSLDLRLIEAGDHEPVWKAKLAYEGFYGVSPDPIAGKVLEAMRQDGILPAPASSK